MTTQTLRGMANNGSMHWRGYCTGGNDPGGSASDEVAAFRKFNGAFASLLGRSGPLTDNEMQAFADFALALTLPPNPIRALDDRPHPGPGRGAADLLHPDRGQPHLRGVSRAEHHGRLRHRRTGEFRERAPALQDPPPAQHVCQGRHVRHAGGALHDSRRQRQQGRPGPGFRLPPRRQHGTRRSASSAPPSSISWAGTRSGARWSSSCSPSTATSSRSSASR